MSKSATDSDMSSGKALRLQDFLPYRLAITSNRVSRMVAAAYRARFGLSLWEWRVIAILGEGEPVTAQDLADAAAMDKVAVSRAVRALVERGLVLRSAHSRDKRSSLLDLTDDGRGVYAEIAPIALEAELKLLEGLSEEEAELLARLLERIRSRAQAMLDQSS